MKTCLVLALACASSAAGALARVTLPVASSGADDVKHDPDSRVVVSLQKGGAIWVSPKDFACGDPAALAQITRTKPRPVTLNDLSRFLRSAKANYHRAQKLKGKSGYQRFRHGTVSRVSVLLRVDKDVPWCHVNWVLHIVGEQALFRVQLAVKLAADSSYSREEARLLGVKRRERTVSGTTLEGVLDANLPNNATVSLTGPTPRLAEVEEISVRVALNSNGRAQYIVGKRATVEPAEVRKWIAEGSRQHRRVRGRISADSAIPVKYVVIAIDCFKGTNIEDIDWFDDNLLAPAKIRTLDHLPALPTTDRRKSAPR